MDVIEDDVEKALLKLRFDDVTGRDVLRILARYYPFARKNDRRTYPKMIAMYLNIAYNLLTDYTLRDLQIQLGLKHTPSVKKCMKHEVYYSGSAKYREMYLLVLIDLDRLNKRNYETKIKQLNNYETEAL